MARKVILALLFIVKVSTDAHSQNVSLKAKDVSLEKVFSEIGRQTGYSFVCTTTLLQQSHKVSVALRSVPLKQALDSCLRDQPLTYNVVEKLIVIVTREQTGEIKSEEATLSEIIKGSVINEAGEPLPGVTLFNRNNKLTSTSDEHGKFQIPARDKDLLEFTSIGYKTLVKRIEAFNTPPAQEHKHEPLLIKLFIDAKGMSEMVVMGYGELKRKDITGSVSSIRTGNLKEMPLLTADQLIAGRAAGVQVSQPDGTPGGMARILIRGGSSLLGGNAPLYIIDGVQVNINNPFIDTKAEMINPIEAFGNDNRDNMLSGTFTRGINLLSGIAPQDIERIDILKDASSAAIYGSVAANGVVMITTRKGKTNQQPVVDAQLQTGMSIAIREKLLNATEHNMILKEAALNLNEARALRGEAPDASANLILQNQERLRRTNTNWQDLVLQSALQYSAHLSVQGGSAKNRYYAALGSVNQNGTVLKTGLKRTTGIVNVDQRIGNRLLLTIRSNIGYTRNQITNGVYPQALLAPPFIAPYTPEGKINVYEGRNLGGYDFMGFQNPLALLNGQNSASTLNLRNSIGLEYELLNHLTFRSQASLNYTYYSQLNYSPPETVIASVAGTESSGNGTGTQGNRISTNTFYENTLTWNHYFQNGSHVNLVGGTTWQVNYNHASSESAQGFANGLFNTDFSLATTSLPSTHQKSKSSLLSFYLRSNFTFKDKYIVTFTGRSDASSKYAPAHRVGYYPSGGIAWRVSKENWLKKVTWIDDLKIRASVGYTGSQNISDYLYFSLYSAVNYQGQTALVSSQLGNNHLKPELTLQKDLGLEFSLFHSHLRGSIGYYEKWSRDLLFPTQLPYSTSYGATIVNEASLYNKGIELELSGNFSPARHFTVTSDLTISANRSRVENIKQDFSDPNHSYTPGNTIIRSGEPVGLIYGREFMGLIQNQLELDAYKASFPQYARYQGPYLGIGDPMYKLTSPTSTTTETMIDEKLIIGKGSPLFFGGFANKLTYKNISLDLLLTFSYGNQLIYLPGIRNGMVADLTNKTTSIRNHWAPENRNATYPRLIFRENSVTGIASNHVYDASFLKVKTVKLAWQLPFKPGLKKKIREFTLYIAANNLYSLTNYPGTDAEVNNDPYSLISGYSDVGSYPATRSYIAGIACKLW